MGHVKKPGTPEYVMEWLDPGRNAGHTNMNWDDSDDPKQPATVDQPTAPDDEAEPATDPAAAPDEPKDPPSPPEPQADPALGDQAPAEPAEGETGRTRDAGAAPENRAR